LETELSGVTHVFIGKILILPLNLSLENNTCSLFSDLLFAVPELNHTNKQIK